MLYQSYQNYTDATAPMRNAARSAASMASMIPGFDFGPDQEHDRLLGNVSARASDPHPPGL